MEVLLPHFLEVRFAILWNSRELLGDNVQGCLPGYFEKNSRLRKVIDRLSRIVLGFGRWSVREPCGFGSPPQVWHQKSSRVDREQGTVFSSDGYAQEIGPTVRQRCPRLLQPCPRHSTRRRLCYGPYRSTACRNQLG